MNAVERLWRALRKEDWASAEAQLHEHVVIRWPHTGERFDRASDYLTAHRVDVARRSIDVRRLVTEGRDIGLWAVVGYGDDDPVWHCAAIYKLHETRIARGVEVWTQEAAQPVPRFRAGRDADDDGER